MQKQILHSTYTQKALWMPNHSLNLTIQATTNFTLDLSPSSDLHTEQTITFNLICLLSREQTSSHGS